MALHQSSASLALHGCCSHELEKELEPSDSISEIIQRQGGNGHNYQGQDPGPGHGCITATSLFRQAISSALTGVSSSSPSPSGQNGGAHVLRSSGGKAATVAAMPAASGQYGSAFVPRASGGKTASIAAVSTASSHNGGATILRSSGNTESVAGMSVASDASSTSDMSASAAFSLLRGRTAPRGSGASKTLYQDLALRSRDGDGDGDDAVSAVSLKRAATTAGARSVASWSTVSDDDRGHVVAGSNNGSLPLPRSEYTSVPPDWYSSAPPVPLHLRRQAALQAQAQALAQTQQPSMSTHQERTYQTPTCESVCDSGEGPSTRSPGAAHQSVVCGVAGVAGVGKQAVVAARASSSRGPPGPSSLRSVVSQSSSNSNNNNNSTDNSRVPAPSPRAPPPPYGVGRSVSLPTIQPVVEAIDTISAAAASTTIRRRHRRAEIELVSKIKTLLTALGAEAVAARRLMERGERAEPLAVAARAKTAHLQTDLRKTVRMLEVELGKPDGELGAEIEVSLCVLLCEYYTAP